MMRKPDKLAKVAQIAGKTSTSTRSAKGKRKRDEILEAARTALMEEGHAAFTIRNVADRLGINLGHFYYYFPSKESLVEALVERVVAEYKQAYEDVMRPSDEDPKNQLTKLIDLLLNEIYHPETLQLSNNLWTLIERESDAYGNLANEIRETERTVLSKSLKPLCPDITHAELKERVTIFQALVEGLALEIGENPEELPGIRDKVHHLAQRLILDPDLFDYGI